MCAMFKQNNSYGICEPPKIIYPFKNNAYILKLRLKFERFHKLKKNTLSDFTFDNVDFNLRKRSGFK